MCVGKTCFLLALLYLVVVVTEEHVRVTMCCPEGRILQIRRNKGKRLGRWLNDRGDDYIPRCVRSRRALNDTLDLEGSTTSVVDFVGEKTGREHERKVGRKNGERSMILKKNDVKLPSCSLGIRFQMINFKGSVKYDGDTQPTPGPYPARNGMINRILGLPDEPVGVISVPLTSEGNLIMHGNTYKAGEFCLARVFKGEDDWDKEILEGEAVAVMCEPCKSEVLCSVLLHDYYRWHARQSPGSGRDSPPEISGRNSDEVFEKYLVQRGDKNANNMVDFDEFKTMVHGYVKKVFEELDNDGDGALDNKVSMKSLSVPFLVQLLDEAYLFFDLDQDNMMSLGELPFSVRHSRTKSEHIKRILKYDFGIHMSIIPAPFYKLFETLDKDNNEKISKEEATGFLKRILAVIDKNEDCHIDLNDIIDMLGENNLPEQHQLALKLLADHYLQLGDFILQKLVAAADANADEKTTLAEIIGLDDTAVLFDILTIVTTMGYPHIGTLSFITGYGMGTLSFGMGHGYPQSSGLGGNWKHQEEVLEMWLHVLQSFIDSRKFQSAPNDFCSVM